MNTPIPRARFIRVTAADGLDHAVSDCAFDAGRKIGKYEALCADVIYIGAMTEPGGRLCLSCRQLLRVAAATQDAVQSARDVYEGRHRRRGTRAARIRRMLQASGGASEDQSRSGASPDPMGVLGFTPLAEMATARRVRRFSLSAKGTLR
jgi:hypothetical protein